MLHMRRDSVLAFTLPVVVENVLTIAVSMAFASIVSRVSGSSLAAMGTVNTFLNFLTGFTFLVTMSSSVLVSRLIGERDARAAGEMVEQSLFLAGVVSIFVAVVCAALAEPIVSLLSPASDARLRSDTVAYYMVMMLSFPFLALFNTAGGVLRAAGDSRSPLICSAVMNALQILLGLLFINGLELGMTGVGLAYVGCRMGGAAVLLTLCFLGHRHFQARISRVFRPRKAPIIRMLRVGIPGCVEQLSVQGGYMVGNSLVVGLGSASATVYNVVNTVNIFPSFVMTVAATVTVTMVGNLLGAGETRAAKKKGLRILAVSACFILALYGVVALFSRELCALYTSDPAVLRESAMVERLMILHLIPGISINVIDPALRTGGDTKFVMTASTIAVWAVRLPLALLLCYHFSFGVVGAMIANFASLFVRMGLGLWRYGRGKWLRIRV